MYYEVKVEGLRAIISFVMSVRPHGTTRHPNDRFSQKSIFQYFSKSVQKIQVLIKI